MITPLPHDPSPWWRHRMMWLVLGGPAAVVVAGIVTAMIAIRGADPVVPQAQDAQTGRSAAPAMQGRNHAATPVPAKP